MYKESQIIDLGAVQKEIYVSMFANNALLGVGLGLENKERSKEDQKHY